MSKFIIECRHVSGSSHWAPEPDCEFDTAAEANAAIRTLETTDEEGAALEYRVTER